MAITFVEQGTIEQLGGGEFINALQENDIVFIFTAADNDENHQVLFLSDGYTVEYLSPSISPHGTIQYKIMGASPDVGISSPFAEGAYCFQIWRGVDPSNPFDVPLVDASGGSGMPNAGSNASVNDGALHIAVGMLDDAAVGASVTAPAGYSNLVTEEIAFSERATVMAASKTVDPASTENPAAFGGVGTGAWRAQHIILRPAGAAISPQSAPILMGL